jgi:hypothetical protein
MELLKVRRHCTNHIFRTQYITFFVALFPGALRARFRGDSGCRSVSRLYRVRNTPFSLQHLTPGLTRANGNTKGAATVYKSHFKRQQITFFLALFPGVFRSRFRGVPSSRGVSLQVTGCFKLPVCFPAALVMF